MTDPRLGKMNTARWAMASKLIQDKKRQEVKEWANFFGNSAENFEKESPSGDDEKTVRVYPLSMFMNPEVYNHLTERQESIVADSDIPPDVYEQQVKQLEEGGQLTDIESIVAKADEKVEEKKQKILKEKLRHHVIFDDEK